MVKFYERYTHERNYGCRIREYIYNRLRTVTLENELLRVSVLADKGTDIFEFLYKPQDLDFMWHSFNGIKSLNSITVTKQNPGGSFLDFYEGGWQELFPNINDDCEYMGAHLGMHGEVCLLPWQYSVLVDKPEEIRVKFQVRTVRTPFYLEKELGMRSEDPTLYIRERVINEGCIELQFMWGHHPAFGPLFLDDNCVIQVPENVKARTYWVNPGGNSVLPLDKEFVWPQVIGSDGRQWDVSRVPSPDSKIVQMYYLYDLPRGWYMLKNTKRNVGFELKWDKNIFPILWVWGAYGGFEQYPWYGRNYNLALEPWSAVPHNLAELAKTGKGIRIRPQEEIETVIEATAAV